MFNALDELFARTQENDELEWMDLLGNRFKCIFKWEPAIEPEKLIELKKKIILIYQNPIVIFC
jgi:hypothetical protein